MKITSIFTKDKIPDWVLGNKHMQKLEKSAIAIKSDLEEFNMKDKNDVSELDLCLECEKITKCANNQKTYYYNETWNSEDLSHLIEYAKASGVPSKNIIGLNPDYIIENLKKFDFKKENELSFKKASSDNKLGIEIDAFKINEILNQEDPPKENWEKIEKQSKLNVRPSMETHSIKKRLDDSNLFIINNPSIGVNQNSILNPYIIENLSSEEIKSASQKLIEEKEENKKNILKKKEELDSEEMKSKLKQEKISLNILSKKPKNNLNIYNNKTPVKVPTEEDIKKDNEIKRQKKEAIKKEIQRPKVKDSSWKEIKNESHFGQMSQNLYVELCNIKNKKQNG